MENLDLNSQDDAFPHLASYTGLLQSDGGVPPGGATDGGGSGRSGRPTFQPPRRTNGAAIPGRGGRQPAKGGVRRNRAVNIPTGSGGLTAAIGSYSMHPSGGAGGGVWLTAARGRSSPATSSFPAEDYGDQNNYVDEDNQPKKYSECKKFRRFMPTYLDQLAQMFHTTTVDGRSSCIPGDTNLEDDDDDDYATHKSLSSSSSRKRKSSTTDSATSPPKKHKSPMVRCIKRLIDTIQAANNTDVEVTKQIQDHITQRKLEAKKLEKQQEEEEIDRCMQLAKQCGATEETEEFYVATMLFAKKYHRTVFLKLTTNAERMAWLKKYCRDWSARII